jgi:iron complex transport system substrate-binding protein
LHRRITATVVAMLALIGLAACGDDEPTVAGGAGDTTETTAAEAVEVPQRIVSISPTATEILWEIGAADQVVAVDDNSNYPSDVPTTDISSYEPNVEAIASYDPDLVVTSSDAPELVDGLEALDIPVLVHLAPTELDGVYEQITELGEATGHVEEAEELVAGMQADIESITGEVDASGLTYYYELDPTFYSVTGATFIGKVLGELGLTSIADDASAEAADYPQLSSEHIVASDPDLILLADTKCCQQDAAAVAARPGWNELRAVQQGNVVELDDDVASRWGPRLVDLLRQVAKAAAEVEPAG